MRTLPSRKKTTRKQKIYCLLLFLILPALLLSLYFLTNDSRRFHALAKELFYSELSGNTLNLHYTLAFPEEWGFTGDVLLPSYEPEEESGRDGILSTLEVLSHISPEHLEKDDAYTCELLTRYLKLRLTGTAFQYYDEPLSPSLGMQSGLPILLADYTFRSPKDVEDYLHILDQTDTYFEGLLRFEKEKAEKGLFMSDEAADKIIRQCSSLMDPESLSQGTHFLHTTFKERLDSLEQQGLITAEQKQQWIWENDRILTTVTAPAYEKIADAFTVLKGSGVNSMGLCHFPEGQDYYEYLLSSTTGSSRSVSEIKTMLWKDFQQNLSSLVLLLQKYPELALRSPGTSHNFLPSSKGGSSAGTAVSSPEEMLEDLQTRIKADFPPFPETRDDFTPSYTVKSVSPSMESYSSPAYYLTPPVDDMSSNIIYINHRNEPDPLTLYTTLAHEGYPGHLYQTVYSQLYFNQHKVSPVRYLLHYGGYTEGWALYAEDLSYRYARSLAEAESPVESAWFEACRLNRNLLLCLYSLLDIAIHFEGASPAQVQAILKQTGINDPEIAASIYQYIVEEPANYPKYYLGFLEFLSLKNQAEKLWGEDFSLQNFHRFVLETGPSDFQGLSERLTSWKP